MRSDVMICCSHRNRGVRVMAWAPIEELNAVVAGKTTPIEFLTTVAARSDAVALRSMRADASEGWSEWTWAQYADQVARAAAGLRHLGVTPGERVLLMMRNRPDFHWLDT